MPVDHACDGVEQRLAPISGEENVIGVGPEQLHVLIARVHLAPRIRARLRWLEADRTAQLTCPVPPPRRRNFARRDASARDRCCLPPAPALLGGTRRRARRCNEHDSHRGRFQNTASAPPSTSASRARVYRNSGLTQCQACAENSSLKISLRAPPFEFGLLDRHVLVAGQVAPRDPRHLSARLEPEDPQVIRSEQRRGFAGARPHLDRAIARGRARELEHIIDERSGYDGLARS